MARLPTYGSLEEFALAELIDDDTGSTVALLELVHQLRVLAEAAIGDRALCAVYVDAAARLCRTARDYGASMIRLDEIMRGNDVDGAP